MYASDSAAKPQKPGSPYFTGVAGVSPSLHFSEKTAYDHMLDHNGKRGIMQLNNAKSKPSVSGFDLERKKEGANVKFSPPGGNGTKRVSSDEFPGVAQSVGRQLWELEAARSNRATRTNPPLRLSISAADCLCLLAHLN